jgi:hypothetical protein
MFGLVVPLMDFFPKIPPPILILASLFIEIVDEWNGPMD